MILYIYYIYLSIMDDINDANNINGSKDDSDIFEGSCLNKANINISKIINTDINLNLNEKHLNIFIK